MSIFKGFLFWIETLLFFFLGYGNGNKTKNKDFFNKTNINNIDDNNNTYTNNNICSTSIWKVGNSILMFTFLKKFYIYYIR
jgi:hypothetical protein